MAENKEKLIAKLQIEYARVEESDTGLFYGTYDYDNLPWDIGLLYITNLHLWFVNSEQEKSKVPMNKIAFISDIYPIEGKRTKFSDVMDASHMFHMSFLQEGNGKEEHMDAINNGVVFVSGSRSVLDALRAQLKIRAAGSFQDLYEKWQNRKLSVLMYLGIRDEERLSYFLHIPTEDLVNIILKRSNKSGR